MPYRALYLHIPFCKAKCAYCDFDSRALGGCALDAAMDAYCDQLRAQVDAHGMAGELAHVETVYVGGGTPSLLGGRLVELVDRVRGFCDPIEFTCEANPESFSAGLARSLRDSGVTRISLGIQSLQPPELKAIGRIHSAEQALAAVALAKDFGFSTSCDLMCGLPGQTLASWGDTLKRVLAAGPDHVSVYPLQLEEGTPLERLEATGKIDVPDEDFQASCMDIAAELLRLRGYERYEVASYARSGHRCLHNIAYWTGASYLGLGRSAASMCSAEDAPLCDCAVPAAPVGRMRCKQLDDEGERFEREELSPREATAEDLMLACRMTDGIGPELLERAVRAIPERELSAACDRAVERGLAEWDSGRLKPTHLGWLEGNELFGIFWGLAEEG